MIITFHGLVRLQENKVSRTAQTIFRQRRKVSEIKYKILALLQ